jgi:hypothetical protein
VLFLLKLKENSMPDLMPETPNINDVPTPSQAEGEENPGSTSAPKTTPSQAEGDEETIDESLEKQS